jgi:transposase
MSASVILGIDVAKQKFDVALLRSGKFKNKVFKNTKEGFEDLSLWLIKQGTEHVHACLEATSTYGEGLAVYLHDAGHMVSIVNPARIKGFAQSELLRTKNDKVDSGLIARFCLAMHPEAWTPPAPAIRDLQALVRRADALIAMRIQEENRLGVSLAAVEPSIKKHIAYLESEIEKIKSLIREAMNNDDDLKNKRDLLISIPGISDTTIAVILSELNALKYFDNPQKVVAFIGLAPKDTLSGISVKGKPRICKIGNSRLRKALYMPALVAIRHNPIISIFYNRLKEKGKKGKVIVCAVMRKLVHIIFGILKSGMPFNPNYHATNVNFA